MFLCVTVLLLSALQCSRGSYSDSWAVQIHGGEEEAARLAIKHGFINRGKVCMANLYIMGLRAYVPYNALNSYLIHS